MGDIASGNGQAGNREEFEGEIGLLYEDGILSDEHRFPTADLTAKFILSVLAPLSDKDRYGLEVGGSIIEGIDGYRYTRPQVGSASGATLSLKHIGYHTHPSGSIRFSNRLGGDGIYRDSNWVERSGKALYVGGHRSYLGTRFAVCEPGNCNHYTPLGAAGRVLK